MAATDAADYTLQQNNISGFAQAFFQERFGLSSCGLVTLRSDARFGKGNVWQVRGRIRDLTALQTPTAATDLTINDISQYAENGIVARRQQVYGIEDMAAMAAADETAMADYAALMEHNLRYGVNSIIHNKLLVALFNTVTDSCLNGTHFISTNGAVLESPRIQEGLRVWGENGMSADGVLMHSYVRSKLYEKGLIEDGTPDLIRELETTGIKYGGRMSGAEVFVDDMCYAANSGGAGVYNTYLFKNGAITLGYDGLLLSTKIGRDELLGGGTDYIKGTAVFSPHVSGTTTSLTPTVSGGATDAEILAATNWTKRTGVLAPEIGIVCIQSTEV